jgi:type IV pilus assembly protein PilM
MLNFGAVWGIDVGDSALKAVKLKRVGKAIALLDFRVIRYSEIGGEPGARREGMLPQAIAALQQAGLRREHCIVSIGPQMVFNRFISLPPVDKRRIPQIVLYEAKQQIPFNLNEVVWAYEPIRKEFVLGEEIEIGLFAAKREVIDAYLAELAPIRTQLYGVQVSPLALFNFIRHEVAVEKPTVVIDVGAQSTNLLILDGKRFWLRNLPIAGNSFTSMLEKRLNIPRAEAEKLKYTVADSRHRRRLLEVLRPVMRDLVAEIQRSVGYYKSLSQAVKFEEILVTGEGYKLFGLDRFLAEQLQYQITPIHELKNIVYQGEPERLKELEQNLPALGVAVGLGLQGLDSASATINLLPESFVIERELHSKRYSGLIAAALIWAIVGCLYAGGNQTLERLGKLEGVGEGTLKKVTGLDQELKEAERGKNPARQSLFENFGRNREYYSRLVGAVSAVIPRDIQIDAFRFTETTPSSGSAGGAMGPGGGMMGGPGMSGMPGSRGGMPGPMPSGGGAAVGPGGRGAPVGAKGTATPTGPTDEEKVVAQASIRLTFTASCDAGKNPDYLKIKLPAELAKAAIYPDKISAILKDDKEHLAIAVGEVFLTDTTESRSNTLTEGGPPTGGARGFPAMGGVPGARDLGGVLGAPSAAGVTRAPVVVVKTKESAIITIGLITPKEADALLVKLKETREKEAKEKTAAEAASAAVTARPAESAPPPPTPPGAGPKR